MLLFVGFIHGLSNLQCLHGLWREIIVELDGFGRDLFIYLFIFGGSFSLFYQVFDSIDLFYLGSPESLAML